VRKDKILAQAILMLQAHDGPAWETFMKHLHQYKDECARDLLSAPPETIQVMQGRARGAQEMVSCIEAARETLGKSKEYVV
jgi:hypothetical protein